MDLPELAEHIAAKTAVTLSPASPLDLQKLVRLGAPPPAVAFFSEFEPKACAEIADARLWPITELLEENTNYVPGADLHPRGLLVIATTTSGDAYCVDVPRTRDSHDGVVLMSHELSWEGIPEVELKALRKVVASSFNEFLHQFVAGQLDVHPLYQSTAG